METPIKIAPILKSIMVEVTTAQGPVKRSNKWDFDTKRSSAVSKFMSEHRSDLRIAVLFCDEGKASLRPSINRPSYSESAMHIKYALNADGIAATPVELVKSSDIEEIGARFNLVWLNCPLLDNSAGRTHADLADVLTKKEIPFVGNASETINMSIHEWRAKNCLVEEGLEPDDYLHTSRSVAIDNEPKFQGMDVIAKPAVRGTSGLISLFRNGKGVALPYGGESIILEPRYPGPEYYALIGTNIYTKDGIFKPHIERFILPYPSAEHDGKSYRLLLLKKEQDAEFFTLGQEEDARKRVVIVEPPDSIDPGVAAGVVNFMKKIHSTLASISLAGFDVMIDSQKRPRFINMDTVLDLRMPEPDGKNLLSLLYQKYFENQGDFEHHYRKLIGDMLLNGLLHNIKEELGANGGSAKVSENK